MNALEALGGFLLMIIITAVIGALLMVLQVHIIYDIADIYGMTLFAAIPVEILYGILFILNLIRSKFKSNEDTKDKSSSEILLKALSKQGTMASIYLLGWGLAALFHAIVF